MKVARSLSALAALALVGTLIGCEEKADIQKDAMDPRSLKALENPPPGMPGIPAAPAKTTSGVPGVPEGAKVAPDAGKK